jgi:hypothetical protein
MRNWWRMVPSCRMPRLTAFCRRQGIGYRPPEPAGRYDFAPGEELQHDTSPHELELAGRKRKVQTADSGA